MSLNFNYDDEEVKKKAQETKQKHEGGGGNYAKKPMKLNKGKTYLVILPSNSKKRKVPYFESFHYDVGQGKNYRRFASGASIEDRDDVMDLRKKLYDAYKEQIEANKKPYKPLAQNLGIRKAFHVNAVKLKIVKKKWVVEEIGVANLPSVASKLFLSDLGDYGVKKICHPDSGKILIIEGNGQDGFGRRYDTAKWHDAKPMLLKKDIVSEEDLEEGMSELEEQQQKFSVKGIKEFIKRLKSNDNFKKLLAKLEAMEEEDEDFDDEDSDDDLDMESDDDDDSLEDDDMDSDDDELEDDDMESDDDDLDDELEDDDDLDDDLEDDDELDDDLDDEEEEEEVDVQALKKEYNAKLKKYKASKNAKAKAKLKAEIVELKKTIKENS